MFWVVKNLNGKFSIAFIYSKELEDQVNVLAHIKF